MDKPEIKAAKPIHRVKVLTEADKKEMKETPPAYKVTKKAIYNRKGVKTGEHTHRVKLAKPGDKGPSISDQYKVTGGKNGKPFHRVKLAKKQEG